MRVVATAGHVDHGKSTLLRALTGMEPDRYEEERRRGITLDLGFVWTDLPSGRGVAFVDVPGHARLVRTMLAGVGAVDLCLFVVAANEGWMPQTEEHLRILELVGAAPRGRRSSIGCWGPSSTAAPSSRSTPRSATTSCRAPIGRTPPTGSASTTSAGNKGTQCYAVPRGTEVTSGLWTVLVWCQTFDVPVAGATPSGGRWAV